MEMIHAMTPWIKNKSQPNNHILLVLSSLEIFRGIAHGIKYLKK